MKRTMIALGLLALAAGPARAEQVKMKMGEAHAALSALAVLSKGKNVTNVKDGSVNQVPYKGWSLQIMMAMSKDIEALKATVMPYEQAIQQRSRELADAEGKLSAGDQLKMMDEDRAARDKEVSVDVEKFSFSDLKPESNDISNPLLIVDLKPLLTDAGATK